MTSADITTVRSAVRRWTNMIKACQNVTCPAKGLLMFTSAHESTRASMASSSGRDTIADLSLSLDMMTVVAKRLIR